jgi:hypothetical protein
VTLGVVLTLGGVTGGRGQELSGSVTAPTAPSLGGFVLPTMPENWADLPFKLTASQEVSFNSNIDSVPLGVPVPAGEVRGDFTSTTNFGFSTRANVSGQQLYLDTSFGLIRYLHQAGFNSTVYSVSAGDNWTLTSRCAGNLGVSLLNSPVSLTELVATGINYTKTTALNETGKCAVSNGYSLLFNSGWTELTNSNPVDALNNSRTTLISAGIEYAKGASTVTALASNSYTIYDRGAGGAAIGLADVTDFHTFSLQYARQINPNLSVNGLIGVVGTTGAFTLGIPRTLLPIYTLGFSWAVTPKMTLTASGSRTTAPPTTILANAETTYSGVTNLTYQVTPKVAFNVGGSISYSTGAFTPTAVTGLAPFLTGASDDYTATMGLTYAMTPFLTAALTASYTERVSDHLIAPQDVVLVSLNYRPY